MHHRKYPTHYVVFLDMLLKKDSDGAKSILFMKCAQKNQRKLYIQ